jgi:prophage tail gpP-like protein
MPKASELCTVVAYGTEYVNWKTVEVTSSIMDPVIDHAMLTVSEISSAASNFSNLKLKPGDPVQVYLGNRQAIDGFVYLRQAAADAYNHGVQIGIASFSHAVKASTVDAAPGQYTNQTLQQIVSSCFGKVGVKFSIDGNPSGADLVFQRVSEHLGESRFDFAARLCNMRDIMLKDSPDGMVGFRGAKSGSGLTITQGYNMLKGRVLLQTWDAHDKITVDGQDHSNESADDNRATQGVAKLGGIGVLPNRPMRFAAEETGPKPAMQMRADMQAKYTLLNMIDGDIEVIGWFTPDGSLWMEHVREKVSVKAGLLLPQNEMDFMIKGVVHRQSDVGGTTTSVLLTDQLGVNGGSEALAPGSDTDVPTPLGNESEGH